MEITIDAFETYTDLPGYNSSAVLANASRYADRLRVMTIKGAGAANPGPESPDVHSAASDYVWAVPSAKTLSGGGSYFSAECWATGTALADLHAASNSVVPIGLLSAAMGACGSINELSTPLHAHSLNMQVAR